jgi:hypothetical protein
MKWFDWVLIAVWVAFVTFIGPWLISAPSWIAVGLGFAILLALVVATFKRVNIHYE